MGYLILAIFTSLLLLASGSLQRDNATSEAAYTQGTINQQATGTMRYLNSLVDYLYQHPISDGSVPDAQLGFTPPGVKNIIQSGRLWVYQPNQHGLLRALATASSQSAFIGTVKSRRLVDLSGLDMQVSVPSQIPDGYIVYLN